MIVKRTHELVASAAVLLGLSVAGCSTQAKRVDCDWSLKPINRPAPPSAAPVHAQMNSKEDDEK